MPRASIRQDNQIHNSDAYGAGHVVAWINDALTSLDSFRAIVRGYQESV